MDLGIEDRTALICGSSQGLGLACATALAEAVRMTLNLARGGRKKVVLSPAVNPRYQEVVRTYLRGTDASLISTDLADADAADLVGLLDGETATLVIQNPNFFGQFEEGKTFSRSCFVFLSATYHSMQSWSDSRRDD